jgi:hypothetical protein
MYHFWFSCTVHRDTIIQNVQLESVPYFNMCNLCTKIYKILYDTTNLCLQ